MKTKKPKIRKRKQQIHKTEKEEKKVQNIFSILYIIRRDAERAWSFVGSLSGFVPAYDLHHSLVLPLAIPRSVYVCVKLIITSGPENFFLFHFQIFGLLWMRSCMVLAVDYCLWFASPICIYFAGPKTHFAQWHNNFHKLWINFFSWHSKVSFLFGILILSPQLVKLFSKVLKK